MIYFKIDIILFFFSNINTAFHTNSTCLIPNSAFQSFFNVFTQISPLLATFGWNIFVVKNPLGGSEGKFFPKTSFMRNNPPAYGVPAAKYVQYTIFLNSPLKIYEHNVLFDSGLVKSHSFSFSGHSIIYSSKQRE